MIQTARLLFDRRFPLRDGTRAVRMPRAFDTVEFPISSENWQLVGRAISTSTLVEAPSPSWPVGIEVDDGCRSPSQRRPTDSSQNHVAPLTPYDRVTGVSHWPTGLVPSTRFLAIWRGTWVYLRQGCHASTRSQSATEAALTGLQQRDHKQVLRSC